MGLFDFIAGKFQQMGANVQEAQMEAEYWSARKICDELKRNSNSASSVTRTYGYMNALRSKCEKMSSSELKHTFDYAYYQGNANACNAMITVMDDRGLAYKDDNGKFVKLYK